MTHATIDTATDAFTFAPAKALIDAIKDDSLIASKARDAQKSSFLTTLLSEASMPGKNDGNRASSDAEVIAICAKFDKNLAQLLSVRPGDAAALAERGWLAAYLPQKLDEAQLSSLIDAIGSELGLAMGPKDMCAIIWALKTRAAGRYDGALASKLVKAKTAG